MAKEYIEREAVIRHLQECEGTPPEICYTYPIFKAIECFVEGVATADVVEVPCHCKDCRYNDPSWQLSADSIGCRYWGIYPDPDDWCCKAERKGGE